MKTRNPYAVLFQQILRFCLSGALSYADAFDILHFFQPITVKTADQSKCNAEISLVERSLLRKGT